MPVNPWLLGVGAAAVIVGGAYYLHQRSASSTGAGNLGATITDSTATDPTTSDSAITDPISAYLAADPTNPAYPVGLSPNGVPGPVTNEQWARLASDELIAKGDDPTIVSNALYHYINGQQMSPAEQAVVAQALITLGAPPEGIIPLNGGGGQQSNPPAPASPASPATPNGSARRYVIVARYKTPNPPWNSTLSGIASHFGVSVQSLMQINHISNEKLIFTGQKIWIDPA